MQLLSEQKITYQKGKEIKKEEIRQKPVMDSVADNLVIDSENLIKELKDDKSGKIHIHNIWIKVKDLKKGAKKEEPKK